MLKSLFCCCCGSNVRRNHRLLNSEDDYINDDSLVLPGELQWDKVSKSFKKSNSPTRSAPGYVPPSIPSFDGGTSKNLPIIEDFKLLRTVGRGAFGKV